MALLLLAIIWFSPEVIFIYAGDQYDGAVFVVMPVAMGANIAGVIVSAVACGVMISTIGFLK